MSMTMSISSISSTVESLREMYTNFDFARAYMSDLSYPTWAAATYLFLVFLLRAQVRVSKKGRLSKYLWAHNGFLCVWSLVMCVGCLYETIHRAAEENSAEWFFCETPSDKPATGKLYFWSYVYYISKYYELLDTILAILNGSSIPFFYLHIFHHTCVLFMAFAWLQSRQTLQFGGLIFNTFVHVIMYYYYSQKALGVRVSWKQWITRVQIIQFVWSFLCFAVTCSQLAAKGFDGCAGTTPMLANLAFNMTLLWSFVDVLFKNSKKKVGASSTTKKWA